MFEPDLFLSLSFFTYFLFSLPHPTVNLVWHTQRSGKQSAVSRPIGLLLLPQSLHYTHTLTNTHTHTHTHTQEHKRAHRNLRMIAQSHISTVNLALFAPTAAHDSPCQFGLRSRRKPFPVVPGWSDAARPGVLCSHSLGRGSQLGRAWVARALICRPPLGLCDPVTPPRRSTALYAFVEHRDNIFLAAAEWKLTHRTSDTSDPDSLSPTLTRHNRCLTL